MIDTSTKSKGNTVTQVAILRCGCGDPDSHNGKMCQHESYESCEFCKRDCPRPCGCDNPFSHNGNPPYTQCLKPNMSGEFEVLGNVAFEHKSPFVRLANRLIRSMGHSYKFEVGEDYDTVPNAFHRLLREYVLYKDLRVRIAILVVAFSGYRLTELWISQVKDANMIRDKALRHIDGNANNVGKRTI